MSTKEVATILGIGPRSVGNLINEGRLDAVSCASGWCIDLSALERLDYRRGRKRQAMPESECCAYAILPQHWVDDIAAQYSSAGHVVETGTNDEGAWVRVRGLRQADLCRHLNDPLGMPGEQETRHPNTNRHQRKVKRPLTVYDRCCIEEEARYLRPDDD